MLDGPEAEHLAKARRARAGEAIALHDGAGLIAIGSIEEVGLGSKRERPRIHVRIDSHQRSTAQPTVHVYTAVPKGGRVDEMIEQLSQVGAASWSALRCERSVVEPRTGKLDRLERIAIESMKQCGRPWLMRLSHQTVGIAEAVAAVRAAADAELVFADASGESSLHWAAQHHRQTSPVNHVHVFVGPEGGWSPGEIELARSSGARLLSFGPHVMRIETAAVVAAAATVGAKTGWAKAAS